MMLLAPTITETTNTMKTMVLAKPLISPPQIRVAPAATMAMIEMPIATGPEIDWRTCWRGDSQGSAKAALAINIEAIKATIRLNAKFNIR